MRERGRAIRNPRGGPAAMLEEQKRRPPRMWLEPVDNRCNEPVLDRWNKPPFEIGTHRAWVGDVVGPLHQDIVHGLESIAVWRTELAQRRDGPLRLTLRP